MIKRIFSFDSYNLIFDFLDLTDGSGIKLENIEVIERDVPDCGVYEDEEEYKDPMIRNHKKFARFIKRKREQMGHNGNDVEDLNIDVRQFTKQYIIMFNVEESNLKVIDDVSNLVGGVVCKEDDHVFYENARKIVCLHANREAVQRIFNGNLASKEINIYKNKFGR